LQDDNIHSATEIYQSRVCLDAKSLTLSNPLLMLLGHMRLAEYTSISNAWKSRG